MNLECAQCQARYRIDDAVIPPQGARVRCRHCSNVIAIPAPVIELAPSDLELIPPPAKDSGPPSLVEIPVGEPRMAPTAPSMPEQPPALTESYADTPVVAPAVPPTPAPPTPAMSPAPAASPTLASPQAPAAPSPSPAPPDAFEHFGQAPASPPPMSEEFERFTPTMAVPATTPPTQAPSMAESSGAPVLAPPAPSVEPVPRMENTTPAASLETTSPALAGPVVAAEAPEEAATASASPQAVGSPLAAAISGGSPIPDGLSPEERTKHEKARRLARVLASDIAIYNREKKDQGAREGNLVAVLGYEIKKSWEVYKERVGAEFANSTPYFRDALNDMLAEGKKIF
jgi:predicted Zn finger-like uncharacterized protein